jgi:branched-chain amino acid transport system permease protein
VTADLFVQVLVNGLQAAVVYALVALGLTLVFSIMGIVNFAHGELYMLAGFLTFFIFEQFLLEQLGWNAFLGYVVTFLVAVAIIGLFGFLLEKGLFRPFRGDLLPGLIVSFGLSAVLQMGAAVSFGALDRNVSTVFPGISQFLGASLANERIAIMLIGLLLIFGLHLFIQRTKIGLAMRAVVQDRQASELYGINFPAISSTGFAVGAALAAAAGVLLVPATYVSPFVGSGYVMKAFIIIIIGGLGSIPGVLVAGAILGLIESFGSHFFNLPTATMISFLLMIAILLIRPSGLMGRAER